MKKHRKLKIALIVIVLIGVFVSAVGGLMIGSLLTKHDIQKIADYMYSIQCGNYNYAIAEKMMGLGAVRPGCSAVRNGSIAGRNFDWYLSEDAEFVVTTPGDDERYATMGVAALTGIDCANVERGEYNLLYEFLPFYLVDGVNEKGLFVSVNVVPSGDAGITTGTNPGKEDLANVLIARYLLDYAASVDEAVELLSSRNVYAYADEDGAFELHFMVCDREKTAVIEFIDNKLVVTKDCSILTNFYVGLDEYTDHAMGIERYQLLKDNYEGSDTVDGMLALLKKVEYSQYYDTAVEPRWYSESYGDLVAPDGEVFSMSSDLGKFEPVYLAEAAAYENAERDGTFWETTHSSVYDLGNLSLSMYIQEGDTVYTRTLSPLTAHERQALANSNARQTIIPLEILCAIMMLAVLYGMVFENKVKDRKSSIFTILVIAVIVAVLSDITAWNYDGMAYKVRVQATSNYLAMIMSEVIGCIFILYEYEFIREKEERGKGFVYATIILNSLAILIMTVMTPLGKTFYFVDGVYYTDSWYYISYFMGFVNLLLISAYALASRKVIGSHDAWSFSMYTIVPLITTILETFNPKLELAFVSIPVAILLIYILLQSGKVNELHMRHKLLQELSYNDALTGLQNRRAYDEALAGGVKTNVGVIFCDVNGLKYANDNYGHKAGDALLVKFAEMLKGYFDHSCIYRISGDEFVIIWPDVASAIFYSSIENLKDDMLKNGDIASLGSCYSKQGDLLELIGNAEKDMYKDKAEFYRRNPKYDRRNSRR